MMWGYPNSWRGWLLMTVGMLGFWGLLIALGVALVRRPGPPDQQRHSSPEEILAEGFARGELDADQYRERLRVLREQGVQR
jgi:putative membrane protein